MQGWGYGSWGGGPWGIGNLIVGKDTLTITTLQASWKSDMIITTGAPTATSTTGFAVTLEIGHGETVGQGSLSFTGFAPNIVLGTPVVVEAGTASLTFASFITHSTSSPVVEPGVGSITITEQAASITTDAKPQTNLGTTSSTSFQASVITDAKPTTAVGSLSITLPTQDLVIGNSITSGVGSIITTGNDVVVNADQILHPNVGSITISTKQASLTTDAKPNVGFTSLFDAQYQVSLIIGNSVQAGGNASLAFSGKQALPTTDQKIHVGFTTISAFAGFQPIILAGTLNPVGRSVGIQREARRLVAAKQQSAGQDLETTQVDQFDLSRTQTATNVDINGNDVQKVA